MDHCPLRLGPWSSFHTSYEWLENIVQKVADKSPLSATRRERSALTLSARYAFTSFFVLVAGALAVGFWVTNKIEESVLSNTAAATAIYMDSFIAPLSQELAAQDHLNEKNVRALDDFLKNSELGKRVVSMKIWKQGGLIAYSSRPGIIGKEFPETDNLKAAWSGVVTSEFDTLDDEEDALERASGIPLLEMYAPIRGTTSGKIIAVAEFYEVGTALRNDLFDGQLKSWLVVAAFALTIYGLLFGIVHGGSRTIQAQQVMLRDRIDELSTLRDRLKKASRRSAEINETLLRRVGSELHDGPAQLISLALLRLDMIKSVLLRQTDVRPEEKETLDVVENMLSGSLTEIRQLSSGLALPELDGLTVEKQIQKAVESHRYRTGMDVDVHLGSNIPTTASKSLRICLYRLIQESLNNAYLHSGVTTATVRARMQDGALLVEIADQGSGFEQVESDGFDSGLGLPGLRERIESIGGSFSIESAKGRGTRIHASLPIRDDESTL